MAIFDRLQIAQNPSRSGDEAYRSVMGTAAFPRLRSTQDVALLLKCPSAPKSGATRKKKPRLPPHRGFPLCGAIQASGPHGFFVSPYMAARSENAPAGSLDRNLSA